MTARNTENLRCFKKIMEEDHINLDWDITHLQINYVTKSMEQSPSLESNSSSAIHTISVLTWNPTMHYRLHKIICSYTAETIALAATVLETSIKLF